MTLAVPMLETAPPSDRFAELARSPFFADVVAANRLYLSAAVADPLDSEREHWALSCLPATGGRSRFSTVSMGRQEVFAVFKPRGAETLTAKVIVSRECLAGFGDEFDARGLERIESTYLAAGDDQVQFYGEWVDLSVGLAAPPLREAARVLAERLLPTRTTYARFHDFRLAGRVLGRS